MAVPAQPAKRKTYFILTYNFYKFNRFYKTDRV